MEHVVKNSPVVLFRWLAAAVVAAAGLLVVVTAAHPSRTALLAHRPDPANGEVIYQDGGQGLSSGQPQMPNYAWPSYAS